MSVTLRIPRALRRYSDGLATLPVEATTAGAALDRLFDRFPALRNRVLDPTGNLHPYLLLFHDHQPVPAARLPHHPLPSGATLDLVAAAAGG